MRGANKTTVWKTGEEEVYEDQTSHGGTEIKREDRAQNGPYGVDLSSSLETEGRKDPEKMRRVMEIIRNPSSVIR